MDAEQKTRLAEGRPLNDHDCEGCQFLESFHWEGTWYDLYVHWDDTQKTVISRFGYGPLYNSGLPLAVELPTLGRALTLAIAKGIVPKNVAYPLSVRKAFRDDVEKIEGFGNAALDALFDQLHYRPNTKNSRYLAAQIIMRLWMQYYNEGYVDMDTADMPRFMIEGKDSKLTFKWMDKLIVANL
jgi:hypothetical protein